MRNDWFAIRKYGDKLQTHCKRHVIAFIPLKVRVQSFYNANVAKMTHLAHEKQFPSHVQQITPLHLRFVFLPCALRAKSTEMDVGELTDCYNVLTLETCSINVK